VKLVCIKFMTILGYIACVSRSQSLYLELHSYGRQTSEFTIRNQNSNVKGKPLLNHAYFAHIIYDVMTSRLGCDWIESLVVEWFQLSVNWCSFALVTGESALDALSLFHLGLEFWQRKGKSLERVRLSAILSFMSDVNSSLTEWLIVPG